MNKGEKKNKQLLVKMNKEDKIITTIEDELKGSAKRLKTKD
jgi:hypothetical protein